MPSRKEPLLLREHPGVELAAALDVKTGQEIPTIEADRLGQEVRMTVLTNLALIERLFEREHVDPPFDVVRKANLLPSCFHRLGVARELMSDVVERLWRSRRADSSFFSGQRKAAIWSRDRARSAWHPR